MDGLSGNAGYLAVMVLLLCVFCMAWVWVSQKNMKKKIAKTEQKILDLQRQQEELSEDLGQRMVGIKKSVDDTTNKLLTRLNGVLEKVNIALTENKKTVSGEIAGMISPIQASFKETHHTLNRSVTDNRKEIKRLADKQEELSKEVHKVKGDLRERTIDLEL